MITQYLTDPNKHNKEKFVQYLNKLPTHNHLVVEGHPDNKIVGVFYHQYISGKDEYTGGLHLQRMIFNTLQQDVPLIPVPIRSPEESPFIISGMVGLSHSEFKSGGIFDCVPIKPNPLTFYPMISILGY